MFPRRPDFEKDAAALAKLFRNLPAPRREPAAADIPYEWLIGDIPRQLLLMRPVTVKTPKPGGKRKGLRAVESAAGKLLKALDRLSPHQLDALSMAPAGFKQLRVLLRVLKADAAMDKPVKRGRPPRSAPSQAKKIAAIVAQHYHELTGKRPTPYDKKFVKLLTDVYQVLGVRAKAESQATMLAATGRQEVAGDRTPE